MRWTAKSCSVKNCLSEPESILLFHIVFKFIRDTHTLNKQKFSFMDSFTNHVQRLILFIKRTRATNNWVNFNTKRRHRMNARIFHSDFSEKKLFHFPIEKMCVYIVAFIGWTLLYGLIHEKKELLKLFFFYSVILLTVIVVRKQKKSSENWIFFDIFRFY